MKAEYVQIIVALISLAGISVTSYLGYLGIKESKKTTQKVEEYHKEVNGKVSKLLEIKDAETVAKVDAAGAKGELKGAEDNQAKTDAKEQDKK